MLARPWGFRLKDINAGPVRWYHGNMDQNTSSDAAEAMVRQANKSGKDIVHLIVWPGLDHHGIQRATFHESLAWLEPKRR
jgi:hypothetical protein